ncbi:MAG: c-type cytochrome [Gammaproteobacteria bacterium]|nr:c-type cytochrome [Gammaproteobacteria bacterium]
MSANDKQFATVFVAVLGILGVLAIVLYFIAGYLTEDMASYKPEEVILENIKPVGQVNIAAESGAADAGTAASAPAGGEAPAVAAAPMSPEQVYQSKCLACHGTGVPGAPQLGDAAAWSPRIAKGMDAMLANATNGLNAMPPKGLCMECSDADLRAVIEYMVSKSQ